MYSLHINRDQLLYFFQSLMLYKIMVKQRFVFLIAGGVSFRLLQSYYRRYHIVKYFNSLIDLSVLSHVSIGFHQLQRGQILLKAMTSLP